MANFDALRSAIIGPLEYICRPKEIKPCFLFQLTANLNATVGNATATGNGTVKFIKVGTLLPSWNQLYMINNGDYGCPYLSVSTTETVGNEWTMEFMYAWPESASTVSASFAGVEFARTKTAFVRYSVNGTSITPGAHTYSASSHLAFVYNNGTLRVFENGTLLDSRSVSLTNNPQSLAIQDETGGAGVLVSNLRLVPVALGTDTTYPVPTALYTGYEAL